jgi:APA family basic amino acid/polyamine antiporter
MATALVVGNMIGSGVFLLPASLGPYGAISMLGWAFTLTGAALLAVTFARLARRIPKAGGPYAYARAGVGELAAFLVAWGYWISICAGNAAIAVAGVGYLGFFWRPLATSPGGSALVAVAWIWLLTWVNARGVREAGGVQLVTTVLKLLPLAAIGTIGLTHLQWANFTPFNAAGTSTVSAVTATAALTLWAFSGLESATVPANDVENPDRTIPLATILGTLVAGAVYILGTVAVMGVIPPATLATSTSPFADAAVTMWGTWGADAVAAGAAISCFGALNGWILLQGQVPMAAAADGLLPRVFGRLSPRATPATGLVISSVLVTLIVAMNYTKGLVGAFTFIILLATITTLVPYALSSLALARMQWAERGEMAAGRLIRALAVTLLSLAYSVWAIVGSGADAVFWGCVLLLAGLPVYAGMRQGTQHGAGPDPASVA